MITAESNVPKAFGKSKLMIHGLVRLDHPYGKNGGFPENPGIQKNKHSGMYRIFSEFAMLESIHANSKISKFELNLSLSNLEAPGVSTWADFFHGYPPVGNSIAQHRGVPGLGWILNLEYP